MNGNTSVTATFTLKTYTITASAGANGSISPSGSVTVNHGANQTFSITPNSGYNINDVKVDGASVGKVSSYTFTNVTANHTIEASFSAIATYTLTITKGGTGTGTVTNNPTGTTFGAGTVVTLTATPNANSTFTGWSGGYSGTSSTCPVTMNGNTSVTATFMLKTYTITASAGTNGSISPPGSVTVSSGGNQTFTITPATNYKVADVKVDGVSKGAITSYTFSNVTSNHSISATFTMPSYTITASAGSNGSISPKGNVTVNSGGSKTFTIKPNTHYRIADVKVDGVSKGTITSYTFSNVTSTHSISVTFVKKNSR
jgi:ABC-type transporter MlaC component